jgi:hypothetical protein
MGAPWGASGKALPFDDIEAISALARIPRTADGLPDWSAASPIDADLATKLISKEWQYADRVARSA